MLLLSGVKSSGRQPHRTSDEVNLLGKKYVSKKYHAAAEHSRGTPLVFGNEEASSSKLNFKLLFSEQLEKQLRESLWSAPIKNALSQENLWLRKSGREKFSLLPYQIYYSDQFLSQVLLHWPCLIASAPMLTRRPVYKCRHMYRLVAIKHLKASKSLILLRHF